MISAGSTMLEQDHQTGDEKWYLYEVFESCWLLVNVIERLYTYGNQILKYYRQKCTTSEDNSHWQEMSFVRWGAIAITRLNENEKSVSMKLRVVTQVWITLTHNKERKILVRVE